MAVLIPDSIVVAGHDLKNVIGRRDVTVGRRSARVGGGPVQIQPRQFMSELNFLGSRKAERGQAEIQSSFPRRNRYRSGGVIDATHFSIDAQFFDPNRRQGFILEDWHWRNARQTTYRWKPESSVRRLGTGGLAGSRTFHTGEAVVSSVTNALNRVALAIRKVVQHTSAHPENSTKGTH